VDHSPDSRRRSSVVDTAAPQQVEVLVCAVKHYHTTRNSETVWQSDVWSALLVAIVDECQ
jgi:hypothetical protein